MNLFLCAVVGTVHSKFNIIYSLNSLRSLHNLPLVIAYYCRLYGHNVHSVNNYVDTDPEFRDYLCEIKKLQNSLKLSVTLYDAKAKFPSLLFFQIILTLLTVNPCIL